MRIPPHARFFIALACAVLSPRLPLSAQAPRVPVAPAEAIVLNDNLRPAGELRAGVLTLRLEARSGTWTPDGSGSARTVAAWAEAGAPLQDPGPLVRVPAGTTVRVSVRNSLDKPLTVFGLGERRGLQDSAVVAPGQTHAFAFTASQPGTWYYLGKTTANPVLARVDEDSQLNGAIVVDAPGHVVRPHDRVFVLSWWTGFDSTAVSGLVPGTLMAINGRPWPNTERIDLVQGDSVEWRWVNAFVLEHPLHLHGFYFRVDGVGDGARFDGYAPGERRQAVTETVLAGGTLQMTWAPTRPGNWVFHCHFAGHTSTLGQMNADRRLPEPAGGGYAMPRAMHHAMSGLVLGIHVRPRGVRLAPAAEGRRIRLLVRSHAGVYGPYAGYAYVLGGSPAESHPEVMVTPGPTLVLERGQRVAVTIVNQSHEPAAVHWHGIELESYADGVPGWSGDAAGILPAVAPGDSLTVRFTPPRAGTFMYHSHFNEFQQLSSGLYGAIVVLDRGARYDPDTDRVWLFSDDGPTVNVISGPFPRARLNGELHPAAMELRAGTRYRLRLINIRSDYMVSVALRRDGTAVAWRAVAKDGADLPPAAATSRPAELTFGGGEIYDFEYVPDRPGELELRFWDPDNPQASPTVVSVHVR